MDAIFERGFIQIVKQILDHRWHTAIHREDSLEEVIYVLL